MSQSAEERIAAFTRSVGEARTNADRLDQMAAEIKAIEAAESSPDRSVTITAGASGSVKSVKITDAALSRSAQALSQLVHQTFQLAMAKAARQQAEIVQRYAGGNTKIVEKVAALQEDLLNPQVKDGFQLHGDARTANSVLVDNARQAPPRPPQAPPYPAQAPAPQAPPARPVPGHPAPNQPSPPPARPAPRAPREDYDDFDSGPLLTDDGARSRPATPPPARRTGGDVFQFGQEDY